MILKMVRHYTPCNIERFGCIEQHLGCCLGGLLPNMDGLDDIWRFSTKFEDSKELSRTNKHAESILLINGNDFRWIPNDSLFIAEIHFTGVTPHTRVESISLLIIWTEQNGMKKNYQIFFSSRKIICCAFGWLIASIVFGITNIISMFFKLWRFLFIRSLDTIFTNIILDGQRY